MELVRVVPCLCSAVLHIESEGKEVMVFSPWSLLSTLLLQSLLWRLRFDTIVSLRCVAVTQRIALPSIRVADGVINVFRFTTAWYRYFRPISLQIGLDHRALYTQSVLS